jgi:HAD superfamily phosphoserine phosphatase-like hydrolase
MNVYDFDNTIFKGDSTARFCLFTIKRHPKLLRNTPSVLLAFVRFYCLKKGTKTECKQTLYRFLTGIDNIDKEISLFWKVNESRIKAFYLRQQKEDDVIISASPSFLLSPICKKLGIRHLIASEVNPRTGIYSGENCHGEEKVLRFRKCFKDAVPAKFYSDSYSDTPMAKISKEAYMVKNETITPWIFKGNTA